MKKNLTTVIVAMSALFFSVANAQTDTVRIKETTKETTIVHDTVVAPNPTPTPVVVAPPPPVQEEPEDKRPDLRRGEFGIRYLPTFSSLALRTYNGDVVDGELSMSHGYGVMLGFNFSKHVGIQGEVNYNEISQKYKDRGLERQVSVSYLNIPVMLSLNTDKSAPVNWNFVAGPQFGLNVGSSIKTTGNATGDTLRATVGVKEGDVGFAYGTGFEFALNRAHTLRLDLGFRGFYGFVDMSASNTSSNPDTYNILVKASRKTYSGYLGLTWCF
jgi:hypothetical protein